MPTVTSLTSTQVDKIQIDEGLVYLDYGVQASQVLLGPTRGGAEFTATATIRDIEFDGRVGKTAGMQVIESQEAVLKVNCLCCSQDIIKRALPGCQITGTTDITVKNAKAGVISAASGTTQYLTNVTMFAKLMDGKYKKISLLNAMHEGGFSVKAVQKAENEIALEFYAHYGTSDLNGDLYTIEEITSLTSTPVVNNTEGDG